MHWEWLNVYTRHLIGCFEFVAALYQAAVDDLGADACVQRSASFQSAATLRAVRAACLSQSIPARRKAPYRENRNKQLAGLVYFKYG